MNCASARCRRARPPRRNEKRAPDSFAAVAKSSSPRALAEVGVILDREIERARRPPAADFDVVVGRLADRRRRVRQVRQIEQEIAQPPCTRSSSPRGASFRRRCRPLRRAAPTHRRPCPCAAPICFDSALRRACSSCVRVWMSLRSRSSASKRAASSVTPRLARPAATAARSLRRRLMSSIRDFSKRARRLTADVVRQARCSLRWRSGVRQQPTQRGYESSSRAFRSRDRSHSSFSRIFASRPRSVGSYHDTSGMSSGK